MVREGPVKNVKPGARKVASPLLVMKYQSLLGPGIGGMSHIIFMLNFANFGIYHSTVLLCRLINNQQKN